jgi:hypothetical protein
MEYNCPLAADAFLIPSSVRLVNADVELANSSSQWEARACCLDRNKKQYILGQYMMKT